ncbi:putative glycoside hydrolase [Flammeovirga sp. SubArs3]|uniref:putative glycoside hydrolase n=1 Tax=Flammeovirga sp. SubArs3 TaxID=2995316 RepID=UPI00248B3453|nr:putative glycoside hydrolase [Flammeovirga sp. SubArs3]
MKKREFLKLAGLTTTGVMLGLPAIGENIKLPKRWMWLHAHDDWSDAQWEEKLDQLKEINIEAVLLGGTKETFERMYPLLKKRDIEMHAWMWTLNRNGDKEAQKHPEWYTVSGDGRSCHEYHPYVDYYQWVCPSQVPVQDHIIKQAKELAQIEGVKGVHLDYVRYSDVILASSLQPLYGIVQDKEYPEYDFCYCQTCRDKFLAEYGEDIYDMKDPTQSADWRQFRYDSVTHLVDRIYDAVHKEGKLLSAAVFPYPELARKICRQSWDDFKLDMVFPMIYNNFYEEPIDWIKFATEQGVKDLKSRYKEPLYTGLFLPALPKQEDLEKALVLAKKGGAKGFAIFDLGGMKDPHWEALKK